MAIFSLASIRLHLDLGKHRQLDKRDPTQIATALFDTPPLERSPCLTSTLLRATHALSLPVNMCVEYVSCSRMFFWSCQHSLCGLESAVFLCKLLHAVAATSKDEPLPGMFRTMVDVSSRVVN